MSEHEDRNARLDSSRGAVAPGKLAHFVLQTSRPEEMVAWYREVLCARVVFSNEMLAFLTYDDEHHRIAIAGFPGLVDRPEGTAGTDHIAFTYPDLGDLLYTYERLRRAGIEPFWCINHGPTVSMYYKDPDANRIELQVDALTADETDAFLASGAFLENPIGVIFDPSDLLSRYRDGEPMADLLARPPLPEGVSPLEMLRL